MYPSKELTQIDLKDLLEKFQEQFTANTKREERYTITTEVIKALYNLALNDQNLLKFLVDAVKKPTQELFIFGDRFEYKEYEYATRSLYKGFLLAVAKIYATAYRYQLNDSIDNIRSFLLNKSSLFTRYRAFPYLTQEGDEELFIWARYNIYKTRCHRYCCETIMKVLSKCQDSFEKMRLGGIAEYFRFLYCIEEYLEDSRLIMFCTESVNELERIFANPSKEMMNEATKYILELLSETINNILRRLKDDGIKRRAQFLSLNFCLAMLNQPTLYRKLAGCKIMNKIAYDIPFKHNSFVYYKQMAEYLSSRKVFSIIFEESCAIQLIRTNDDTIRMLIKKSLLKKYDYIKLFNVLEYSPADSHKLFYRLIDPWRIDYFQIEMIIEVLETKRKHEFYNEDLYTFFENLSRYATSIQLNKIIKILYYIIKTVYDSLKSFHDRKKLVDSYIYVFENYLMGKTSEVRSAEYLHIVDNFITEPTYCSLLIIKQIMECINSSKFEPTALYNLAKIIVDDKHMLHTALYLLSKNVPYRSELIYFLKNLLKKYRLSKDTLGFDISLFSKAVHQPEVFENMLTFPDYYFCVMLMENLVSLLSLEYFPFICIRNLFYKLNVCKVKAIKKELTDCIACRVTIADPTSFQHMETIKYLLFHSPFIKVRKYAAELVAEIYTCFSEGYRYRGEDAMIEFMYETIVTVGQRYREFQYDSYGKLIGLFGGLQLMEYLLLATYYTGVGKLRAHNSLVPTSTVMIKIYNNVTSGDDVFGIFEKKMPSNWTLFEAIVEVAKQFKCDPLEIGIEYPNNYQIKEHGLTLEELGLHRQYVNAFRLPFNRSKRADMLVDGYLTPKAVLAFTYMFNKFAKDGKMGKAECRNYIEKVTQVYCADMDARISNMLRDYDADHDGYTNCQDFLAFYRDSLLDPEKSEAVEKNLVNLRFRKDLCRYDEPLAELDETKLFRYYLCRNNEVYDMLFALINHPNTDIHAQAERLLMRLPTYSRIREQLNCKISFSDKSPFEKEYILTAIQGLLSYYNYQQGEIMQKFIAQYNHLTIFELLLELYNEKEKQKTFVISLYILRSLVGYPNLKQLVSYTAIKPEQLQLPATDIFYKLIISSLANSDLSLLEPALALEFTQSELPIYWIEGAVFNNDKDVRAVVCNFIYYWQLKSNFSVDLFQIEAKGYYTHEWFKLLTEMIQLDTHIDIIVLLKSKLDDLAGRREKLDGNRFDTVANGDLKLMLEVLRLKRSELSADTLELINKGVSDLCPRLLSNYNQKLAYMLRKQIDFDGLLCYLNELSQIEIIKETELLDNFVGIKNFGCICYMNSILQQFFMIKKFREIVLNQSWSYYGEEAAECFVDDFMYQLQQMYSYLTWSQKKFYNPKYFCMTLKDAQGKPINTGIHEDAHEFLNTAFDKIYNHLKEHAQPGVEGELDELYRLFRGKTVAYIICTECKNKIEKYYDFYHLSVEVMEEKSLYEGLAKLILIEEINDYFCSVCQRKVDKITKQTVIKQTPRMLVINLKRITFDMQTLLRVKIHTSFVFPHYLNLHDYVQDPYNGKLSYRLKGVVIHSGTCESGHYYSLINEGGQWYKFNDQTVTRFNSADLSKYAFGGNEEMSQWSDYSTSTNAYILFYEQRSAPEPVQNNLSVIAGHQHQHSLFYKKVQKENELFEKQLQVSQYSFFEIVAYLYSQQKEVLEYSSKVHRDNLIFSLHVKALEMLAVHCEVKKSILAMLKSNVCEMLRFNPYHCMFLLHQLKGNSYKYIDVICCHPYVTLQEIYQTILSQAIVSLAEQEEDVIEAVGLFCKQEVLEKVSKHLYRSHHYFEFFKVICYKEKLAYEVANSGIFGELLHWLMGADSPYAEGSKQELHFTQVLSVSSFVVQLLKYKRNLSNKPISEQQVSKPLSEKYAKILSSINFYTKAMKNRYDVSLISPLISFMCHSDEEMSKRLASMFLLGVNLIEEIDDKQALFTNIKVFLLIDDQFTADRVSWMLGVPQLIETIDNGFELESTCESSCYEYTSSLFFKEKERQPLLNVAFEKRKYFNALSALITLHLLYLVNESSVALKHVLHLPAPNYCLLRYFDWVNEYIGRLKDCEHYCLPMDRLVLAGKLSTLLEAYYKHADSSGIEFPVNNLIIGKTIASMAIESQMDEHYEIEKCLHLTYVAVNLPFYNSNLSLPRYDFSSSDEPPMYPYFIKRFALYKSDMKYTKIREAHSVLTLRIKTKNPLKLKFKLPKFNYTIYVNPEPVRINIPCQMGYLEDIIEVEAIEKFEKSPVIKISYPQGNASRRTADQDYIGFYHFSTGSFGEIQCESCTYVNVNRETCEICDAFLFK